MVWEGRYVLFFFQTAFEGRIYSLKMHCCNLYPMKPPTFQFVHRINMTCVDKNGYVSIALFLFRTRTADFKRLWFPWHNVLSICKLLKYHVDGLFQCKTTVSPIQDWKPNKTLKDVLIELRKLMSSKENCKLSQPAEGSVYWCCRCEHICVIHI